MLVFEEGGNPVNLAKNPWIRDKNQPQTQATYGVNFGIQTHATLVGGEHSHHCVIPAPPHDKTHLRTRFDESSVDINSEFRVLTFVSFSLSSQPADLVCDMVNSKTKNWLKCGLKILYINGCLFSICNSFTMRQ